MARRSSEESPADAVRPHARPLDAHAPDLGQLMNAVGDARLVLLGEASHGTHEFYDLRARITRELIERHGFTAVIVEADWPDAYRVNRFVRGHDGDDPVAALDGFKRFPQWMWRNRDVVAFVEWLRGHNRGARRACGFYGMDLYSLHASIDEVLGYLDRVDPAAARQARERYACFERFESDPKAYGRAAGFGVDRGCREQAVAQLVALQRHAAAWARRDGRCEEDESFHAEQNARLVASAEQYYREMFAGEIDTWNLRDTHMVDTIDRLLAHLDRTCGGGGGPTRAVVWAHNSHLGDARATEMGRERGEVNVGSLCRERWGEAAFNVGFTTHHGTVAAASDWGGPVERKRVRDSMAGSHERVLHAVGLPRFLVVTRVASRELIDVLDEPRLERAIGVIYRPETERWSHYFEARLASQFDAVIHVERTHALEPLERTAAFEIMEAETYPSGV